MRGCGNLDLGQGGWSDLRLGPFKVFSCNSIGEGHVCSVIGSLPRAGGALLAGAAAREGWAAGLLLLVLLCAAWASLFRMDALGQLLICRAPATGFWGAAGMWVVMMSAMMLPSALPMIFT